jgi:aminopeptidase N
VGGADAISPTVHEVAHQWFYGLIGSDQLREPWLDEAAATYSEVLYEEGRHGSGRATGLLSEFRTWLRVHPEVETPIGMPVAQYEGLSDYGLFVYLKGALFFDALRTELGDERFFAFLHEYYDRYAYGFADAAGFQAEAEDECGCDLDALFDLWVFEGGPLPGP